MRNESRSHSLSVEMGAGPLRQIVSNMRMLHLPPPSAE